MFKMTEALTRGAPRVRHVFGQYPWEQPQFYSHLSQDTNNQRHFFIFENLKTDTRFAKHADGGDSWLQISQIPGFVQELHRFSDRRQEIFEGKPLHDESNIGQIITVGTDLKGSTDPKDCRTCIFSTDVGLHLFITRT